MSQQDKIVKTLIPAITSAAIGMAISAAPASADTAYAALSTCLAEHVTAAERTVLTRWFFAASAAHPDLQDLARITSEQRAQLDQQFAALYTRLLLNDCGAEAELAARESKEAGSKAEDELYSLLGALVSLTTEASISDPEVLSAFSHFTRYLDQQKLKAPVIR